MPDNRPPLSSFMTGSGTGSSTATASRPPLSSFMRPAPAQKPEQGFFSKLGSDSYKGIAEPLARPFVRVVQAAKSVGGFLGTRIEESKAPQPYQKTAILGEEAKQDYGVNVPTLGRQEAPTTFDPLKEAGQATKTVSLGLGPTIGGAAYFGAQAAEEGKSALEIGERAVLGGVLGKGTEVGVKLAGGALKAAGGFMKEIGSGSGAIRESAEKGYSQVLGAITKTMKSLSEKIVPRMADMRLWAFSRSGLLSQAEKELGVAGENLDRAWAALPKDSQAEVAPMIQNINKKMRSLFIKTGDKTILPQVNSSRYAYLSSLRKELISILGEENAPVHLVRKYRQILDTAIAASGKDFGISLSDRASLNAQRDVANTIRNEFAKQYPEIAKINNEFTFWSRMKNVLSQTQTRTKSQGTPLGQKIAAGAGAVLGTAKAGISGVIEGVIIMKNLQRLVESTAWRTVSSSLKADIADRLAAGETNTVGRLLEQVAKITGVVLEKTGAGVSALPKLAKELPRKGIFTK